MANVLDVTGKNEGEALAAVRQAFATLAVGQSLEVVSGGDLRGVSAGLQQDQWGAFDWFILEDGPQRWRADLHRGRPQPGVRGIREFYSQDHRRCDDLFATMEEAAHQGDAARATALFAEFQLGMLRHFNLEENGFFPEFEDRTGMRNMGPTAVMRMEHEQMRGLIRKMNEAVQGGDLSGMIKAAGTLLMVMQQHNVKEEQMLYAMADMHIGEDADDLLKRIQLM
ncbi:MAG: hemerythrin domain-containing protein [Magnetococcales bacterium]|nr:hemerythrin domain-containing protein [Magnetococcales bacterium]